MKTYSKKSVISFILAIASLLYIILFWRFFQDTTYNYLLGILLYALWILLYVLAIFFGILGLIQINKKNLKGKTLALIGVVIGAIELLLTLFSRAVSFG